jgi:hypothetical protein
VQAEALHVEVEGAQVALQALAREDLGRRERRDCERKSQRNSVADRLMLCGSGRPAHAMWQSELQTPR